MPCRRSGDCVSRCRSCSRRMRACGSRTSSGCSPRSRSATSRARVRVGPAATAGRRASRRRARARRRNGEQVSKRIEVEVKGHVRRIRRPRYRASCECARQQGKAVAGVIAPLEPTLFRGKSYGLSVWMALLIQMYWQRRPVRALVSKINSLDRVWISVGRIVVKAEYFETGRLELEATSPPKQGSYDSETL